MNSNSSLVSRFLRICGLCAVVVWSASVVSGETLPHRGEGGLLSALSAYYDTSESEVIERLAREAEARRIYLPLKRWLGEAYAGAWFDDQALELVVAVTGWERLDAIRRIGARLMLVEHSLAELTAVVERIRQEAASNGHFRAVTGGWFVDYPTNSVVVEVLPHGRVQVKARLADILEQSGLVRIESSPGIPRISSEIRGADCYRNDDAGYRCSIGFAVAGGYITAGHCGQLQDSVTSCNALTPQGTFKGSTWPDDHDRGWVETISPWVPVPKINGYNDGILDVPAASGGYAEAPLYSTICRYGQRTNGPHCGQILAKNQDQDFCVEEDFFGNCIATVTMKGVTKTDACDEPGDSGGPFIAGDGQAQGTLIGGLPDFDCTDPDDRSWFEPVGGTLDEFDLVLLTTHGANPPDVTDFVCPDMANSGQGAYFCEMSYDTQGPTSIQWTTNTGDGSDSEVLFGTCLEHQTVNVDLLVTNNYGSDSRSASFACPTNELQ